MNAHELHSRLPALAAKRPVCVLGSAVIDVIADAYALPWRGCDIELQQQSVNIGGCALNIALTLSRLGIASKNALPIGQGTWADIIRSSLEKQGIKSEIHTHSGDNGWCLALVEPDGERTFMSFRGVEHQWNQQWLDKLQLAPGTLLSLSGYQLAGPCAELLVNWLESLHGVSAFIDFGPRIADIPEPLLARIMACKPMVSLNRQEAAIAAQGLNVAGDDIAGICQAWLERYDSPLIVRLDKQGAWFASAEEIGLAAPFPAVVVDTIGAGDSHAGGTLAGLAAGWNLGDAVSLGNAVASYVVSHRGGDCAPHLAHLNETLFLADKNV
jgi:sugar/nucleoside kinase (ribokinase family)